MRTAKHKIIRVFTASVFFFLFSMGSVHAAATLSISPSTGTYNVGDTIEAVVNLDGGGDSVTAVDLVIEYDTTQLTFVSSMALSGFTFGTDTESGGTILLTIFESSAIVDDTTTEVDLAKLTFTAKAAGTDSSDYATVDFVTDGALSSSVPSSDSGTTELLSTTVNGAYTISGSTTENTTVSEEDQVGKGTTAPSTGIFDSMNIGVLLGISLLSFGLMFSFLGKGFYKE